MANRFTDWLMNLDERRRRTLVRLAVLVVIAASGLGVGWMGGASLFSLAGASQPGPDLPPLSYPPVVDAAEPQAAPQQDPSQVETRKPGRRFQDAPRIVISEEVPRKLWNKSVRKLIKQIKKARRDNKKHHDDDDDRE